MNDNKTKNTQTPKNPWTDKKNIPSPKPHHLILSIFCVIACSVYFLFISYSYAPYIMCAVGVIATLIFYKSTAGKLLLIISAAILAFGIGSFHFAAMLFAAVTPVVLGSMLLSLCPQKSPRASLLLIALPAASFGIAYLLTESISISLVSLAIYPPIILLSFATVNASKRVSSICHASFGFAAAILLIVGVTVFRKYGEFSPDTLKLGIEDAKAFSIRAIHAFFVENQEALQPLYDAAEISSYKDFISVEALVPSVFSYIPAILIILCNVLGFFAQSGLVNTFDTVGGEKNPIVHSMKADKFLLSSMAAVVFLVAGIVQFIASCSGAETVSLISDSIFLILMPGFALSGFGTLLARLMMSKSKNKVLVIVLLCLFASCMLYPVLMLLSINGAINTLSYHLFISKMKNFDKFK